MQLKRSNLILCNRAIQLKNQILLMPKIAKNNNNVININLMKINSKRIENEWHIFNRLFVFLYEQKKKSGQSINLCGRTLAFIYFHFECKLYYARVLHYTVHLHVLRTHFRMHTMHAISMDIGQTRKTWYWYPRNDFRCISA